MHWGGRARVAAAIRHGRMGRRRCREVKESGVRRGGASQAECCKLIPSRQSEYLCNCLESEHAVLECVLRCIPAGIGFQQCRSQTAS